MATSRIKQYQVNQCVGRLGTRAVPTGERLSFFAYSPKECVGMLAAWLAIRDGSGWKAAKTKPSVRRGSVVWQVAEGYTVP